MTGDIAALKESLARTPFFGGLLDDALERIIGMLVERRYERGQVVFREGESGRSMYIIRTGMLVMTRQGESGFHVKLVRLSTGDFFGETTLIEIAPRSATATAEGHSLLLELTNMDLYRLYKEDIHAYVMVLQNMNRELCRRLRKADGRITEIADEAGDEVTQIRPAVDPRKY
ncbi:MAG: cyclic nucleotide-binding domain-containing protein [Myxococcales bacterium]|nr:cyclic nucleotide-binding domain-containing protein [Myxococcales bacterium]